MGLKSVMFAFITNRIFVSIASMSPSQFALLTRRQFLPLFITQALGAFNDNLFKNALVILVTFSLGNQTSMDPRQLVAFAGGLFILPYFLFSATAGKIADGHEKSALIRRIKLAEILITLFAVFALFQQDIYFLLLVLFFLGTQSAFFGPLKYAILPQQLKREHLIGANALIETATFLAILIGTIIGGILILTPNGPLAVSGLMTITAIAGYVACRSIPPAEPEHGPLKIRWNIMAETAATLKSARTDTIIFSAILGDAWFWFMGSVFLAQLPVYTKDILGGDEVMVTFFLTLFSIGIGAGALMCNSLLKGETSARYAPIAALGMALFSADLYFASPQPASVALTLSVPAFLQTFTGLRISFDLLAIAIAAGVFVVPLFALVQARAKPEFRARTIAADNIIGAGAIVLSAVFVIVLARFDFSIVEVFLFLAVLNVIAAGLVTRIKA